MPSDLSKIVNLSGALQLSAFQYQSRLLLSQENKSWICSSFNFALQLIAPSSSGGKNGFTTMAMGQQIGFFAEKTPSDFKHC